MSSPQDTDRVRWETKRIFSLSFCVSLSFSFFSLRWRTAKREAAASPISWEIYGRDITYAWQYTYVNSSVDDNGDGDSDENGMAANEAGGGNLTLITLEDISVNFRVKLFFSLLRMCVCVGRSRWTWYGPTDGSKRISLEKTEEQFTNSRICFLHNDVDNLLLSTDLEQTDKFQTRRRRYKLTTISGIFLLRLPENSHDCLKSYLDFFAFLSSAASCRVLLELKFKPFYSDFHPVDTFWLLLLLCVVVPALKSWPSRRLPSPFYYVHIRGILP